jgi:hypothetical protein
MCMYMCGSLIVVVHQVPWDSVGYSDAWRVCRSPFFFHAIMSDLPPPNAESAQKPGRRLVRAPTPWFHEDDGWTQARQRTLARSTFGKRRVCAARAADLSEQNAKAYRPSYPKTKARRRARPIRSYPGHHGPCYVLDKRKHHEARQREGGDNQDGGIP